MHLLAFIGSPRKGSITELPINEFIRAGSDKGFTSDKVYLYELDIFPAATAVIAGKRMTSAPAKKAPRPVSQWSRCSSHRLYPVG